MAHPPRSPKMEQLQRQADRISFLIVASDYPDIDVEIAIGKLEALCERLFPGQGELFEMIYTARFNRLREQFRAQK